MTPQEQITQFFQTPRKYINGWTVTGQGAGVEPGTVMLTYNDETGLRRLARLPCQDYFYFYVKKTDKAIALLAQLKLRHVIGRSWIRVYWQKLSYKDERLTQLVTYLEKQGIKTYEADISPMKRLCLDYDVQIEDFEKVRVLYFDIETDDTKDGIEIGRDQVLSFAAVDSTGKEYYLTNQDEKQLLIEVAQLVRQHDMLVGWNSAEFDLPYLLERFKKHKVNADYLWNLLHEDMMKRAIYFFARDPESRQHITSYSLENISQYFLKEGKAKFKGKVIDLYRKDPETLKAYNLQDCQLLRKLEEKLQLIKVTHRLSQVCQVFPQNWSMVKAIDNFLLSEANKIAIHFKTNMQQLTNTELETETYLGAFVLDPIPGLYKEVYVLDFKSLYPNIIRTFNISPDTLVGPDDQPGDGYIKTPVVQGEDRTHGGGQFYVWHKGVIPRKITRLLDERQALKKQLKTLDPDSEEYKRLYLNQTVVKELTNSIYGVLGNKWFREFNLVLAESITGTGQFLIQHLRDYFNDTGRHVLYGDTDSVFLTLKKGETIQDALIEANQHLQVYLKETFNVNEVTVELDLAESFKQFLIPSKKKYAGQTEKKIKYKGLECVKRDTPKVVVDFQQDLIKELFAGKTAISMKRWVKRHQQTVLEGKFKVTDITLYKKLTKKPETYGSKSEKKYTAPLHVRLALESKETFKPGSIIGYVVTGMKSKKLSGILADEFTGDWDRVYYWNHIIYPPLERLLVAAFNKVEWDAYYLS